MWSIPYSLSSVDVKKPGEESRVFLVSSLTGMESKYRSRSRRRDVEGVENSSFLIRNSPRVGSIDTRDLLFSDQAQKEEKAKKERKNHCPHTFLSLFSPRFFLRPKDSFFALRKNSTDKSSS